MTPVLICPTPDTDIPVEIQPNVSTNSFADQYEQSIGIGAFNAPRGVEMRWSNMQYAPAVALIAFLENKRGYKKFLYSMPEEPQRLFKCTKFTYKWKNGRKCDIRATFQEQAG